MANIFSEGVPKKNIIGANLLLGYTKAKSTLICGNVLIYCYFLVASIREYLFAAA